MGIALKYTAVDFSYPDGGTGIVVVAHRNVLRDYHIIGLSVVFRYGSGFGVYGKTVRPSCHGINIFVHGIGDFKGQYGVFTVVEVGTFFGIVNIFVTFLVENAVGVGEIGVCGDVITDNGKYMSRSGAYQPVITGFTAPERYGFFDCL